MMLPLAEICFRRSVINLHDGGWGGEGGRATLLMCRNLGLRCYPDFIFNVNGPNPLHRKATL